MYRMIPNGHDYEKLGLCRTCSDMIHKQIDKQQAPNLNDRDAIEILINAMYPQTSVDRQKMISNELNTAYTQFSTAVVLDYQNTVKRVYYNKCSRGFKEVPCTNFVMTDPLSGKQYKG